MDANKSIELGFADDIMKRADVNDDIPAPQISMIFSKAAVTNSLMDKIASKCKIEPTEHKNTVTADSLMERLNLIKNWR